MRSILVAAAVGVAAFSPVSAVQMPLDANGMQANERIVTVVHATGGGPQTNAKDLRVLRRVSDNNWERLRAGKTDPKVNANYLIYDRPIHAMAAGTVVGCWRNAPENIATSKHAGVGTGKITLGGNHLWIKQADGATTLYAHAIPGSIPAGLCPHNAVFLTGKALGGPTPLQPEAIVANGATVVAGQVIGRVGNSGNSSEPHLHIHQVDSAGKTLVTRFERGQTTPFTNGAGLEGPWTPLAGKALPMATILIWPAHPVGNWTYNGIEGPTFQRIFDHFVNSGEMADTITCKNNGATYDSTWVPAKGSWVAHHRLTGPEYVVRNATYVAQGYKVTSKYTCGSTTAAIWRKA